MKRRSKTIEGARSRLYDVWPDSDREDERVRQDDALAFLTVAARKMHEAFERGAGYVTEREVVVGYRLATARLLELMEARSMNAADEAIVSQLLTRIRPTK